MWFGRIVVTLSSRARPEQPEIRNSKFEIRNKSETTEKTERNSESARAIFSQPASKLADCGTELGVSSIRRLDLRMSADCKSAIRQVANLRYQ
jgi:hypothetical protein